MSVCQLFCNNQSEVPLALGYLAHIVKIITSALNSKLQSTISIVIQYTKPIFTLDYRGLLILIPIYLEQISNILDSDSTYSLKAKSAAVSILASMICIPDHYDKYEIPLIGKTYKMPMSAVKATIVTLLRKVFSDGNSSKNEEKTYLHIICKAICCVNAFIFHEASKTNCNPDLLKVIYIKY